MSEENDLRSVMLKLCAIAIRDDNNIANRALNEQLTASYCRSTEKFVGSDVEKTSSTSPDTILKTSRFLGTQPLLYFG